jgi:glycosyltransferase involved in cell wall biosynthesis
MLHKAGCSVSILFGQRFKPNRDVAPGAAAAAVFSVEIPRRPIQAYAEVASLAAGLLTGRVFRATFDVIDHSGVDLGAVEPPLPHYDRVLNADRLYARASRAFHFSSRFTQVAGHVGDREFEVAHWTAPVPVRMRGVPNIYTLHDLIPLQFPYLVIGYGERMFKLHQMIGREADHIITVSQASKRAIVNILKVPEERISVTYQPVPPLPHVERCDAERLVETVYGVKAGQYALFLGALEPKKNVKRLIASYLLANLDIPLLLAGPLGWLYDEELQLLDDVNNARRTASIKAAETPVQALAAMSGATSLVRKLGFLPRLHVVALLKCAKFFVFPSIYEGFGLPVIEAMQLGVPVLTSNVSSLPEVAGDAAVLVDPRSIPSITAGLRKLNSDSDLRTELARKGQLQAAKFSVNTCRGLLAEAYKKVGVMLDPVPTPIVQDNAPACLAA